MLHDVTPLPSDPPADELPVPVSAPMRHAKVRAFTDHTTVGQVVVDPDGAVTIGCACGMTLTNGPGWSLDEHIRLHRAEARFLALSAVAPAGIPRLVDVDTLRAAAVTDGDD